MGTEELYQSLEKLRAEIQSLAGDNEAIKIDVERMITELEQQLEHAGDYQAVLIPSLKELIADLEVKHPRITGILNNIMVTLGNMGI